MARRKLARLDEPALNDRASGSVKSAVRVMQILELFADHRRSMNAVQVAAALDLPQSSAASLLKTLAELGYLSFDRFTRSYKTTLRCALLGGQDNELLFEDGPVLRAMRECVERTRHTVALLVRNGTNAQYAHILPGTVARTHVRTGGLRSLAGTGAGHAMLGQFADREIAALLARHNSDIAASNERVSSEYVFGRIRNYQEEGYLFHVGTLDCGLLATPLPRRGDEQPVILALLGSAENMRDRHKDLYREVRTALNRHLGRHSATVPIGAINPTDMEKTRSH